MQFSVCFQKAVFFVFFAQWVQPSTQIHALFMHGDPQSADRMALCTPGYAVIKQGLLSQAPHRIPNTMEARASGLAVTSFLQQRFSVMHFLPYRFTRLTGIELQQLVSVQCHRSETLTLIRFVLENIGQVNFDVPFEYFHLVQLPTSALLHFRERFCNLYCRITEVCRLRLRQAH